MEGDVESHPARMSSVASTPLIVEVNKAEEEQRHKLSTGELIVFTYFWTVGGPFGIESCVRAGGPVYTIISLFIVSIFWCLPQGLMSAELSLMTNANGGGVIWAFGNFVGFVSAHASIIVNIANQAVLVVLVVNYINSAVVLDEWLKWVVRLVLVFLITVINIGGIEWISKVSGPLALLVFIPFITEIIMIPILKKPVYWENLLHIPGKVDWGTLISNVVWAYGGFDTMGTLAAEVKGGTSTYVKGLAGVIPLILLTYFFPIVLSYLVFPYRERWGSRAFTDIAFTYTDTLGYSMIVAAVLSQFGQLNVCLASVGQQIWAMAKGKDSQVAAHRYLPYFFSYTYKNNVPYVALICISLITLGLTALNYETLIQLYLLLRLITLYSEYLAFIYLKWKEPDTPRPYEVPGGKVGAILCFLPSLAIGITAIVCADKMALILGSAMAAAIMAAFPMKLLWVYLTHKYDCCRVKVAESTIN